MPTQNQKALEEAIEKLRKVIEKERGFARRTQEEITEEEIAEMERRTQRK